MSAEPSNLAVALMPAAGFAFYSLFNRKFHINYILCIVVFFATTSSLGMLGFLVFLSIYLGTKIKSKVVSLLLIVTFTFVFLPLMLNFDFFERRVMDTLAIFQNQSDYSTINISTYSQLVNLKITFNYLVNGYALPAGVGMYEHIFDKYIHLYEIPVYRESLPGRDTATSFLLKTSVEFGFLGILFFIYYLYTFSKIEKQRGVSKAVTIALFSVCFMIFWRMVSLSLIHI